MKLAIGQVVEKYTVESLIGAGGTAMVYRVEHNQLKTKHALKVLTISSSTIRERMLREGQVQAALQHLNIVAVTDVLDVEGNPGLVMEYIDGPSLEYALNKYRLSMRDAETLYMGIVSGVRVAHDHGLVHRDLKPANVLLARTATGFVPKVLDFGLAKIIAGDQHNTGQTRSGIAMGTPSYMAPEQIRDARTVDQRADIFSLGCILYELLLRRRVFAGEEALSIYNAITRGEYVPPRDILPEMPDRLDMAIRGALATKREDRIPDCRTLARVIRGEETWNVGMPTAPAVTVEVDDEPSRPRPEMQVADRPGGKTPGPAPSRNYAPGSGAPLGAMGMVESSAPDEASDSVPLPYTPMPAPDRVRVDDTLDASDSFERSPVPVNALVWLLVGAVGAVMLVVVLLTIVGIVSTVLLAPTNRTTKVNRLPDQPAVVLAPDDVVEPEPTPEPGPDTKAKTKTETKSKGKAAKVGKVAPAPAAAPQPAAPSPVTVKILSAPPTATISIDGKSVGRTPGKLSLVPGRYEVTVKSGGTQGTFPIDVQAGASNKWCWAFADASIYAGSCPR